MRPQLLERQTLMILGKYLTLEPGFVVVPNSDLKPEYAYGGELGVTVNLKNRLFLIVRLITLI